MRTPARMPAALVVGGALLTSGPSFALAQPPRAESVATDSRSLLRAPEDAFAAVADRVTPAVVNVSITPRRTSSSPGEPSEPERRFREFVGQEFDEYLMLKAPGKR